MKTIKHKFRDHKIDPNTKVLILGTFNPDTEDNPADFFYGRGHNFLWKLLPTAFNVSELKNATVHEKREFIRKNKIDFIDLIKEIEIDEGQEQNYKDSYIDSKVIQWNDVLSEIKKLARIRKICFTRKTFSDIPNIEKRIEAIKQYCVLNKVHFFCLVTPARFYSSEKQTEWSNFLTND